ncbi:sigma-70 family RNA polymerase sigma factor [Planctomicrobium piriforme]|uniref:RNA polymerase sigma-70 factor, ECF subfamily n=1 Tax=Planctomicrobium piriforme TaxID=1576369 RepID=A0A1I3GZF0_9PLAN|nr:sigma-70 family RNA polymerase sigma factor [Planctomicrobium piriforme]SFI28809.1 RNA polymerase sigma-70 factor, ECF subfamily [Planctomicrobium piriforme]
MPFSCDLELLLVDPAPSIDRQYEEFLRLFSQNRERLFAYIFSLLPNHADAEDVFQRCSLLLWRKFSEFDVERNFLAWACGVALNEVRNFLRSAHRDRLRFDSSLVTQLSDHRLGALETSGENLKILQGCLEALKATEQDLVRVAYDGNSTLKDFADATGQALQTLYNRLGRIRRMLLECVRRKLATESLP